MFSIVATETSVLTFVSVPGISYRGDWTFLQLALGYIFGRCLVSYFLLPVFFEHGMTSIYEILAKNFNVYVQRLASLTFLVTRILADGVRFLATAIIIQSITGWSINESILLIGIITLIYTVSGGLKAIIHIDAFQFIIYLFSALICIGFLFNYMDNSIPFIFNSLYESGKIKMFHFSGNILNSPFAFISAFIGGTMLSFASHGSDYMMVQRVLATKDLNTAKKAMIGSGIFVFLQFFLFLLVGSLIYLATDCMMIEKDREITYVIKNILPIGFKGIVIAGVLSAAMSTLSSSINSLSSSTIRDWMPQVDSLFLSRLIAFLWTSVLVISAFLFNELDDSLLIVGLQIASFTYGVLLSFFILSRLGKFKTESIIYGFLSGLLTVFICMHFNIAWTYFILSSVIVNVLITMIIEKTFKYNFIRDLILLLFIFIFIQLLFKNSISESDTNIIDIDIKDSCYINKVWTGSDVFINAENKFSNINNIGLLVNSSSGLIDINQNSKKIISKLNNLNTQVIFTPEHGLANNYEAGEYVLNDNSYNIPILSLYGEDPSPDMKYFNGLDAVIFDIQDIGSRYYTYVSTMTHMMQTCADLGIKFFVLDRPNPISGFVNGPMLDKDFSSFVGMHEINIRHGMTVGELAYMINEEGWLKKKVDLHIVKMKGWERDMYFDDTGLSFYPPSPNIPDLETAILYSGLCLIEGTNVSEGRGTDFPFKKIGAPWINSDDLIEKLNAYNFKGIDFRKTSFIPKSIFGKAKSPKFEGELCHGILVSIIDKDNAKPIDFTIHLLKSIHFLHKDEFSFLPSNFIDKLYGSDELRMNVLNDKNIDSLFDRWFKKETLSRYLIY